MASTIFSFILVRAEPQPDLTIRLTFNDKPPYYYTDPLMKPTGFLLERSLELFKESKIKYFLQELPSKRIQYEIKNSKEPHCSIGDSKLTLQIVDGVSYGPLDPLISRRKTPAQKVSNMPDGNYRYIMCNKAAPEWVIDRLNAQIARKLKAAGKSSNKKNPLKN